MNRTARDIENAAYAVVGRSFSTLVSTLILIADDPRVVENGVAAKMAADCLDEAANTSEELRAIIVGLRASFKSKRAAKKGV